MKQVFTKRELVHRMVKSIRDYIMLSSLDSEHKILYWRKCSGLVNSLGVDGLHILTVDEEELLYSIVERYF